MTQSIEIQVEQLKQSVDWLKNKIQGNGKPGIIEDVASIKLNQEAMMKQLDKMDSFMQDFMKTKSPHTTQEIQRITKEMVREYVDQHQLVCKAEQKEEESKPGSWYDFRKNALLPIIVSTATTIVGVIIGAKLIP